MKIFILTEAGSNIGFGHLARCLALYFAFESKGYFPEILIKGDQTAKEWLANARHRFLDWLKEKDQLFNLITDSDVVVIDSYLADLAFYQTISELIKKPVYIDDDKRLTYPRGFIVNGAIYAKNLGYSENRDITYSLGTEYALLRKEFWSVPEKIINESIEKIMVTFGAEDIRNLMPGILKMLNSSYPKLKKIIIIGRGFRNIDKIEEQKDRNVEIAYYPDANLMKREMSLADVAISAGGQTIYELARLGLPTIGICLADNQFKNLEAWSESGFVEFAGWHNDGNLLNSVKSAIEKMDYSKRLRMSKIGKASCDGQGAIKVVNSILGESN